MKSRATILAKGDENTNFFHNYAKHRKNINTIWEMERHDHISVRRFRDFVEMIVDHFQKTYIKRW
jgi:hypothetical protein